MVRKATLDDLDQIFELYESYALDISQVENDDYASKVQADGFLLDLENKSDFKENRN